MRIKKRIKVFYYRYVKDPKPDSPSFREDNLVFEPFGTKAFMFLDNVTLSIRLGDEFEVSDEITAELATRIRSELKASKKTPDTALDCAEYRLLLSAFVSIAWERGGLKLLEQQSVLTE